jgi:hypothetical protein
MPTLKFPNLFPEDLPKIIQRSRLVYCDGKWREVMSNQKSRTASGVYNFVTQEGVVFILRANAKVGSSLIGHVDLAMGRDVDYAGRLYFSGRTNRGILRKWTNESDHYRLPAIARENAGIPESLFQSGRFKSLISLGM